MRYLLTFLTFLAASTLTTRAQSVKPLIDTQNYVFVAASAQPTGGSERRLTITTYTLKVTKDKIISNLPYFGRSTVTPTDAVESALIFTADKFKYTVTPEKNGGWRIAIKPRTAGYLDDIRLTVSDDGYTILHASFNGMENITFTGQLMPPATP
jgi:hypothetical protein